MLNIIDGIRRLGRPRKVYIFFLRINSFILFYFYFRGAYKLWIHFLKVIKVDVIYR